MLTRIIVGPPPFSIGFRRTVIDLQEECHGTLVICIIGTLFPPGPRMWSKRRVSLIRVGIRGRGAEGYQKSRVVYHAYGPAKPKLQSVGSSWPVISPKMGPSALRRSESGPYRGP